MLNRLLVRAALPLLLLAPVGCGESEDDTPPPPPVRPRIVLEPVPKEQRARYALERLINGPESQSVLRIAKIHPKNLDLAHRDLVALGPTTVQVLDDPALIKRLTEAADTNPWHGVLSALTAIQDKPAGVALRWAEPAVDRDDVQLRRRAVRCLTSVEDPGAARVLMRFLERDARDRMIGPMAFRALAYYGSPHVERALLFAYRRGAPGLWGQVPALLRTAQSPTADTALFAAATAWWNAAVEGSGPELSADLPRDKRFAFSSVRPWLDPQVSRYVLPDKDGNDVLFQGAGAQSSTFLKGAGAFASSLNDQPVIPAQAYFLTGKPSAAEARCALALRGYAPFVRARDEELTLEHIDPVRYYTALHCTSALEMQGDTFAAVGKLEKALDALRDGETVPVEDFEEWVASVPDPAANLVSRALLFRVLYDGRPFSLYRKALESAHDRLAPWTKDLLSTLEELAFSGDGESRALVLHLIRRGRNTAAIPIVERLNDEAGADGARDLRQLLIYLYSRGAGIEPKTFLAFVERFRAWLGVLPEREVMGLATALLDFDDAGTQALAAELTGPRRRLYVAALSNQDRVLPLGVARAMLGPLDRASDAQEVAAVLRIAYLSFPASAANDLASLRARMPRTQWPAIDVALTRVRHRADRR